MADPKEFLSRTGFRRVTANSTVGSLTAGTHLSGGPFNGSANITLTTDATNVNTASTIVARDAGGNFSAGTITASLSGNASTATTLQTARNIDGQSFNGSADITVIAPGTHAASSKATPVDADELPLADSAASFVLKKLTWANLKATLKTYFDTLYAPIRTIYNPADQTITSGGTLTLAHGLGAVPKTIRVSLVCQTGELGYTAGDIVSSYFLVDSSSNHGMCITSDATNLVCIFGSAAKVFSILNKTTGAAALATNANWKIRIYATVNI